MNEESAALSGCGRFSPSCGPASRGQYLLGGILLPVLTASRLPGDYLASWRLSPGVSTEAQSAPSVNRQDMSRADARALMSQLTYILMGD